VSGPAKSRRPLLALLLVTILWGFTFVWMKQALEASERAIGSRPGATVVSFYVAIRFALAAVVLACWPRARRGLDAGAWGAGVALAVLLYSGFLLQMLGLTQVTPAVSAFLTSLYVVFAALLTVAIHRVHPRLSFLAGVVLATAGAGFIEGPPHLTFGAAEWLTVGCAAVFGVHILATDALTKAHAPLAVTLASFVATAGLAAAGATAAVAAGTHAPSLSSLLALLADRSFLVPLLLATILSTVVALSLMNLYQRELDPVRAAILYALEPIWTTLIAWAMGLGRPGLWLLVGGGALLAGNLVAELGSAPATHRDV
jgi:drug/metabolite transporter (DMT)-like permease